VKVAAMVPVAGVAWQVAVAADTGWAVHPGMGVPLSVKPTVPPCRTTPAGVAGLILAVKVTGCPEIDGLAEEDTQVAVL
jgi:hypothetical protein